MTVSNEEEIRGPGLTSISGFIGHDFDTVRRAVLALERGWSRMNGRVSTDSIRITLGVIRGEKLSHR